MSRPGHFLWAVGTAAGIMLTTFNAAMAQDAAASAFTVDTVTHAHPFGTLPIDMSRIQTHLADVGTFLRPFSDDQMIELRQRCAVITANTGNYTANTVSFCNAVLALPTA